RADVFRHVWSLVLLESFSWHRLPERCAEQFAWSGCLCERYDADIAGIGSRFQLHVDILGKALPFLELSDLRELLDNGNVGQMSPAVFAVQYLGFHVTERNDEEHICAVVGGVGLNVRADESRLSLIHRYCTQTNRDLRRCSSLLKNILELFGVADSRFFGSVHDNLWRVRSAQSEGADIVGLALGEGVRGVRVFPAVTIPVVNMLTQNNELRAVYWLQSV